METDEERKTRLEKMVATTQLKLALETEEERRAKKGLDWIWILIGPAKRAPHWGVQSRFRYVGMYVCRVLKCVGGVTYAHAQSLFWAVKTDL